MAALKKQVSNSAFSIGSVPLFWLCYYLYVWLFVNPTLIYNADGVVLAGRFPFFLESFDFSRGFLVYPGGPVEYLAAFASQFYYYSWAGALLITLTALLITWASGKIMTNISNVPVQLVQYIPAIIIAGLMTRYFPYLSAFFGISVSLLFVLLYFTLDTEKGYLRIGIFIVFSFFMYWAAAGAFLIFSTLCGIFELKPYRNKFLGISYILGGFIFPYCAGVYLFQIDAVTSYKQLLFYFPDTKSRTALLYVLYSITPLADRHYPFHALSEK